MAAQQQCAPMLNFDRIANTKLTATPFPHLTATGIVGSEDLAAVTTDFPDIKKPGIFPLSELSYGPNFTQLLEDIHSTRLEELIGEKFGVDLSDKPLMITVRGQCQKKDGRIHNDSKDKIITCLLYLNAPVWNNDGGSLRLLKNKRDINSTIAEVPPLGGNFIAFQRTDNSWHGHLPYVGQRRYIMFNWVRSEIVLAKNVGRHKLSSVFKRFGFSNGY